MTLINQSTCRRLFKHRPPGFCLINRTFEAFFPRESFWLCDREMTNLVGHE